MSGRSAGIRLFGWFRTTRPIRKQKTAPTSSIQFERLEDRWTPSLPGVYTYRFDNTGEGVNSAEVQLTPSNVNPREFGKLFSVPLDGQVYSQPLYAEDVSISTPTVNGVFDVVYAATQGNSLYAIDSRTGNVLWQRSFVDPANGITTVPWQATLSTDISPQIGITSTPLIDPTTNSIYVVAKTQEVRPDGTHYVQTIYATDIRTGQATLGGKNVIADTRYDGTTYTSFAGPYVNGTAPDAVNGRVYFNALRQNQRAALTMVNGAIYVAWASHGENEPEHGWVIGFDKTTLALKSALNVTPNGEKGGYWGGGSKIASDSEGNLYLTTDGGTVDPDNNNDGIPDNHNYSNAVLKLTVDPTTTISNQGPNGFGLKIVDYFRPYDWEQFAQNHHDFGSAGVIVLPDSAGSAAHPKLLAVTSKAGWVWLIDRNNMGGYSTTADTSVDREYLAFGGLNGQIFFNNRYYTSPGYATQNARVYSVTNATINPSALSGTTETFAFPGGAPVISANGTSDAIMWALDRNSQELRAYDANDLSNELYSSAMAPNGRDALLGKPTKFNPPMVVNGQVFVGTESGISVYGAITLPPLPPLAPTAISVNATGIATARVRWTATDISQTDYTIEISTDGVNYSVAGTVDGTVTQFDLAGLTLGSVYSVRVRAYNENGSSLPSPATAYATANMPLINNVAGFTAGDSKWTLNGPANVSNSQLVLTNAQYQASSVFSSTPVSVTPFAADFLFQLNGLTPLPGDGFTFAIQGVGKNAVGLGGAGLGYGSQDYQVGNVGGINKSLAIKFDILNNQGEGSSSTGLYVNGNAPTSQGSVNLSNLGINLASGQPYYASVDYNGSTVTVSIINLLTNVSATQTYSNINLQNLVGGATAYIGFTGGTAFYSANQRILAFRYAPYSTQLPVAPTNLGWSTANQATPAIALNWSPSTSSYAGYVIERRSVTGSYDIVGITAPGTTNFTDSAGLQLGTNYFYRVRAINDFGSSLPTAEIAATTLAIPTTPTNVRAVAIDPYGITFTWDDNSNNEQYFEIFRKIGNDVFLPLTITPANINTYSDFTVQPNTMVEYRVRATNALGYGDFAGRTFYTPPVTPTNVQAKQDAGVINITWNPAPGAVSFNLYRSTVANDSNPTLYQTGITETAAADSTFTANTKYYYSVVAVGTNVNSPRSQIGSISLGGIPQAPSNLTAVANDTQSVTLTWQDNASNETGYTIYRKVSEGTVFLPVADMPANTKTFVDVFLPAGTSYDYRVVARNTVGMSSFTSASAITEVAPPVINSAGFNNGAASLSWYPQYGATGYNVYRTTAPDQPLGTPIATNVPIETYADTQVTLGTRYYYRVTTMGPAGPSAPSPEVSILAEAAPATPTNLTIVQTTTNSMDLQWDDNANNELGYLVIRTALSTAVYQLVAITGPDVSTASDTGLEPGTDYFYFVVGYNEIGFSSVAFVIGTTVVPAPANLTATPQVGRVDLSWGQIDGANSVNLYRSTSSTGPWTTPFVAGIVGTSYSDSAVSANTTYFYRVEAVFADEVGGQSNIASATVPAGITPPAVPSNLAFTLLTGNRVSLTWRDNAINETGYLVARVDTVTNQTVYSSSLAVNSTSYTDTVPTRGRRYTYYVIAGNSAGSTFASISVNVP